jgi:hypothetical protein
MTGMSSRVGIADLASVLPPDLGADERIDWPAAEERWGTRFPTDYMEFMSVYGGGIFNEVRVLMPLPVECSLWDPGTFEEETESVRHNLELRDGLDGLGIDPGHVLAWGLTSGPDILCWLTADPDPDKWPVLVHGRHTAQEFALHPSGMVEFLYKLFQEDVDPYPISIGVRGSRTRWIHWREEERLWNAGLNPMTGEPWD